jgi:mannose-6-phosphate isomerase-like protein (cupin superfamily)
MERQIDTESAARDYGVVASHSLMDNGELRFRLMGSDGNGYIRTVASQLGGWQRAHSHSKYRELYVVETGWMGVAVAGGDTKSPHLSRIGQGEFYVTGLSQVHNVYLPAGAVIHTVKFGSSEADTNWIADEEFTAVTIALSESAFG